MPSHPAHAPPLAGRPVLIVGGGDAALRAIAALRPSGAELVVVAVDLRPQLLDLGADGAVDLMARPFEEDDVRGMSLVVPAADDPEVDRRVREAALAEGVPVSDPDPREGAST